MAAAFLVAHRGYPKKYPENSLVGIRAALDAGARWVECDVQLTRDEIAVLFHDRTLSRVTGEEGAVHTRSLEELLKLDAGEAQRLDNTFKGTRITTLKEVCELLENYPQAKLFVEIKRVSIERFGVAAVLQSVAEAIGHLHNRCPLISFSAEVLLAAREQGWLELGYILGHWNDLKLPSVSALKPEYIFVQHKQFPNGNSWVDVPGAQVIAYETDDLALADKLLHRGVELVETDDFGGMTERLAQL